MNTEYHFITQAQRHIQDTVDAVPIVDALKLLPTLLIAEHTTNLLAQAERRETVKTQLGYVTTPRRPA